MRRTIKHMIRILLSCVLTLSCFLASSFSAQAYTSKAYSIGCLYGPSMNNLDTRDTVLRASDQFSMTGYYSYYSTEPTYSYLSSRIHNDIVLLASHGSDKQVYFNSQDRGGDYFCGLCEGYSYTHSSGCRFLGLRDVNLSGEVKLMILNACQSAFTDDNITRRAVERGANAAIGWAWDVLNADSVPWIERMSNYLSRGYEIYQAMDYADSFGDYYDNSGTKNHVIWGDWHQVLKRSKDAAPPDERAFSALLQMAPDQLDKDTIESAIRAHDPTFSKEEYNWNVTQNGVGDDQKFIVDINLVVDGYMTSQGYTIIFRNNQADTIYDNRKENITTRASLPPITDMQKQIVLEQVDVDLHNRGIQASQISSKTVTPKYDLSTDIAYYEVLISYCINADGLETKDMLLLRYDV